MDGAGCNAGQANNINNNNNSNNQEAKRSVIRRAFAHRGHWGRFIAGSLYCATLVATMTGMESWNQMPQWDEKALTGRNVDDLVSSYLVWSHLALPYAHGMKNEQEKKASMTKHRDHFASRQNIKLKACRIDGCFLRQQERVSPCQADRGRCRIFFVHSYAMDKRECIIVNFHKCPGGRENGYLMAIFPSPKGVVQPGDLIGGAMPKVDTTTVCPFAECSCLSTMLKAEEKKIAISREKQKKERKDVDGEEQRDGGEEKGSNALAAALDGLSAQMFTLIICLSEKAGPSILFTTLKMKSENIPSILPISRSSTVKISLAWVVGRVHSNASKLLGGAKQPPQVNSHRDGQLLANGQEHRQTAARGYPLCKTSLNASSKDFRHVSLEQC
ncbi:hypothetical protein T10_3458 [Trichinella papuae]|uniref:Uncharacterized protein n=1 Tax=Trichinella papuae TaxID=268474 RepID=A0A0V1MKR2_9BILA|nr:hypothetical protein T10_3458 [Trichinella papuae]